MAKQLKLDADFKENVQYFEEYITQYVNGNFNTFRSVHFGENHQKKDYRKYADLDCNGFVVRISFFETNFLDSHFIDAKILYDNSKYEYGIFDVFNLFDIQDFKQYYYSNCSTQSEIEVALKDLLSALEKYAYDIKKAGEPEYLPQLEKNLRQDWLCVYSEEENEDFETDMADPFRIDSVHPTYTHADVNVSHEKRLRKLQNRNAKGKLDTLYEKRLLAYLEQGYTLDSGVQQEKQNLERSVSKQALAINVLLALVSFVLSIIIVLGIMFAFAGNSFMPVVDVTIGSTVINLPLSESALMGIAIATLGLGMFTVRVFGKKVFKLVFNKENNARVEQMYDQSAKESGDTKSNLKFSRIIYSILGIIMFVVGVGMGAMPDICFYDDYVEFFSNVGVNAKYVTVDYEDINIAKVNQYFDSDLMELCQYPEGQFGYIVYDNNQNYCEITYVDANSKTDKYIQNLLTEYNKEFSQIENLEQLYLDTYEGEY